MALNWLRFHNILNQDLDASSDAATELAEVIDEATDDPVTNEKFQSEMERLRLELLGEIRGLFNSHLRWVMTLWVSTLAAIVALAVAIIARCG